MFSGGAWDSPIYRQTALIVLAFIFVSGIFVYFMRKKNYYFVVSWASIKSWLFVAPFLFLALGLPEPLPIILLTTIAIYGAKAYFQIMGMFHRSYFVMICYAGILALGYGIYSNHTNFYNLTPMMVLGGACLVPLARNNFRRMIQYIALTNLGFVFLGWSFMHLGLILRLDNGIYQVMYLIILTEICDNTTLAISRYVGKRKLFDGIDHKRNLEAFLVSTVITIATAGAMRQLLPDRSEIYWLSSGLVAAFGGLIGDMVMTVLRKDVGVKVVSGFVLGRGDFLHRMDRMIFVAPIYYYIMLYLSPAA
ncbi:MAG: hypothetical protein BroJett040_06630 [Oligoflexia bacterium]|nr:MAG: hypothetical protein BroJett040_06630 [Oligoflexia bacterium]